MPLFSKKIVALTLCSAFLVACDDSDSTDNSTPTALDQRLSALIEAQGLSGDPSVGRDLPSIDEPLPQLGMKLFFSKSLGGELDSACVTCHHPRLGGGDDLALSVGVEANIPDLLGPGRVHHDGLPLVPRNAPTTFNLGMWDSSLFHDSRVQALMPEQGKNGANGGIRTPDTSFGAADPDAGANLATAQARFPVTSAEEMRTPRFLAGESNDVLRDRLAARLGDYDEGAGELPTNQWLAEFQTAFNSDADAETLITYDNIALALAEYERSQVFVDNDWRAYVNGDLNALSDSAKRGAELFLLSAEEGGAGCSGCHSGDFFTDEEHHTVAFPQIGVGKGDGNADDFGRERETGMAADRYSFRTPTLLNIEVTGPYGHAGAFDSLARVVRHYNGQSESIQDYAANSGWCDLAQFADTENCETLYPNMAPNGQLVLNKLAEERLAGTSILPELNLNESQVEDLVAFLKSLTDRCVADDECLSDWIPSRNGGPDGQQLNAVDRNGVAF